MGCPLSLNLHTRDGILTLPIIFDKYVKPNEGAENPFSFAPASHSHFLKNGIEGDWPRKTGIFSFAPAFVGLQGFAGRGFDRSLRLCRFHLKFPARVVSYSEAYCALPRWPECVNARPDPVLFLEAQCTTRVRLSAGLGCCTGRGSRGCMAFALGFPPATEPRFRPTALLGLPRTVCPLVLQTHRHTDGGVFWFCLCRFPASVHSGVGSDQNPVRRAYAQSRVIRRGQCGDCLPMPG